ncbi:MAG: hypothetical protein GXP35_15795 [Actinobacteria bacterium]|nr:hypothetical protein [Actinomycetota bacterium]
MGHRTADGSLDSQLRQLCRRCEGAEIEASERKIRREFENERAAVSSFVGSRLSPLHDALWWGNQLRPNVDVVGDITSVAWVAESVELTSSAVRGEIVVRLSRAGLAGAPTSDMASSLWDLLHEAGVPTSGEAFVARRFFAGYKPVAGYLLGPLPGAVSGTQVVPGALLGEDEIWFGRLRVSRSGNFEAVGGFEVAPPTSAVSVSIIAAAARIFPADCY